jgi:hypothetical protein
MSFNVKKYTSSGWLKGEDLDGQPVIVCIKAAYEHEFQDGETKPVIEVEELDEKLVLNKTRTRSLVELLGDKPDAWIGQHVMLYPIQVSFGGKASTSIGIGTALQRGKPKRTPSTRGVDLPVGVENDGDIPF